MQKDIRIRTGLAVTKIRLGLVVLLALGGMFGAMAWWLGSDRCVLGLRGTNATLTIAGWGAQAECNRIVAELGVPVSQWPGLVRVQQPYTAFVLCQQQAGWMQFTVNGQAAAYGGIGLQLCSMRRTDPIYPGDIPPDRDAIDFYPR